MSQLIGSDLAALQAGISATAYQSYSGYYNGAPAYSNSSANIEGDGPPANAGPNPYAGESAFQAGLQELFGNPSGFASDTAASVSDGSIAKGVGQQIGQVAGSAANVAGQTAGSAAGGFASGLFKNLSLTGFLFLGGGIAALILLKKYKVI